METESNNQKIARILGKIGELYTLERDTYRTKTFLDAANAIRAYRGEITSGKQAASVLPRIGPSLIKEIDQILKIGTTDRLEQLEVKHPEISEKEKIIKEFKTIHGIGEASAEKFYQAGCRTILDIGSKCAHMLTEAQRLGILYSEHFKLKIPREEIDVIKNILTQLFDQIDPNLEWQIVGSYRRGELESGDIDILIKSTPTVNLSIIVNKINAYGYLRGTLALGLSKYMGIFQLDQSRAARRLDLLIIDPEEWTTALMYFTGSQRFNILMRQRAKDLGYRLNEHALIDNLGNAILVSTEEDIFNVLGIKYLTPEERVRDLVQLTLIFQK